jgi:DUF1016 N-terminal domain
MGKIKANTEFEKVAILIEEARNRAFSKVNAELVLLYFNVGNIVADKVAAGVWGENTVGELAAFIQNKFPGFSGFTRRGLYRMKQFYELYSSPEFVTPLATQLEAYFAGNKDNTKVPALPTQIQSSKSDSKKVTALRTQFDRIDLLKEKLVSSLLTQISWTNHRLILSKTKSAEEKFYYLLISIKERYSSRELERALNSAQFERVLLSSNPEIRLIYEENNQRHGKIHQPTPRRYYLRHQKCKPAFYRKTTGIAGLDQR